VSKLVVDEGADAVIVTVSGIAITPPIVPDPLTEIVMSVPYS
jgi:hypothetical protein